MDVLIVIAAVLLAGAVVLLISAPLRSAQRDEAVGGASVEPGGDERAHDEDEHRAELEAAREAKYREIRDAELDYRTGKLSVSDYEAIDAQLRAEALAILNELEPMPAPDEERPGDS